MALCWTLVASCVALVAQSYTYTRPPTRSSTFALFDFKLLIQGTKNAYTSVRNNDVLLYKLPYPIQGSPNALGVFKSEASELIPLCNRELGSNEFHIDQTQLVLDASELKAQNKLLRIVSSDRRGDACFVIDEYIDSDVHIPLVSADARIQSEAAGSSASDGDGADGIDRQISLAAQSLAKLLAEKENLTAAPSRSLKTKIVSANAPVAIGPYSQAIEANGMIYVSGCIGFSPTTMRLQGDNIESQTVQALENLKSILESANSSLDRVCKTTILIKDMSSYSTVNQIYAKYFSGEAPPARTTYAVLDLPANALIEIDAIALSGA